MKPRKPVKHARKTLPAALLVEGRECLVVGGGVVAGRKAGALLDAGALVTLVAPETDGTTAALRRRKRMKIVRRAYDPRDLDAAPFMVLAATDDHALNRGILEACGKRRILCACPDRGWERGDFISPASFRHGDLTVSVSTGGASCRRSRMIKDSLARHASALDRADLLILGTDHRHAGLAAREPLHWNGGKLTETAASLCQLRGIHEFMLLVTCNRAELVALATRTPALVAVASRIMGLDRLDGRFYTHAGFDAFRHLALVAAGLYSQTPGETHIRAQLKDALETSRGNGWSAAVLHDWTGRSLRIGKTIRAETSGMMKRAEIGNRCAAFLEDALKGLRGRRALVIGTGAVGMNCIDVLRAAGVLVSCCYRRNPPARRGGAGNLPALPIENLRRAVRGAHAVVCAAAGDEPVLDAGQAGWLSARRPPVVADLGVPRNVSPEFRARRPDVKIADLDDLSAWDRPDEQRLRRTLARAGRIIRRHTEDYERIISGI